MSLDDVNALRAPAINISREGIVPVKEEGKFFLSDGKSISCLTLIFCS